MLPELPAAPRTLMDLAPELDSSPGDSRLRQRKYRRPGSR